MSMTMRPRVYTRRGDVVGVARAQMARSPVNRVGPGGGVAHHQPVKGIGLVVELEPTLVGARGGIDERPSHLAPGLEPQAVGYLAATEADVGNRLAVAGPTRCPPDRRYARRAPKRFGNHMHLSPIRLSRVRAHGNVIAPTEIRARPTLLAQDICIVE